MRKLFFILALFISASSFAQQKQLEKLEMYFDQGNYEVVYRKANRYLKKPIYDYSPAPQFYKSLSMYKMALDGNVTFTVKRSLDEYDKFIDLDLDGKFSKAHAVEIRDYKNGIQLYIAQQKKLGNADLAASISNKAEGIFDQNMDLAVIPEPEAKEDVKKPAKGAPKNVRDSIIAYSETLIGIPYKWGGTSCDGFDCSGFTQHVFNKYGVSVPRIAGDQYEQSYKKISIKQAQKGDLVFFGKGKNITHVGIVVSNPGEPLTMIHASSSRGIMISNIEKSTYWKPKLLYAANVVG